MTMTNHYTPPETNGNAVPYKGKRYWVIEVNEEHPFEWVDSEVADFAVYDKLMGYVNATIIVKEDGRLWVQMATHCDSGFHATDLKEAARTAGRQDEYMSRKGWA